METREASRRDRARRSRPARAILAVFLLAAGPGLAPAALATPTVHASPGARSGAHPAQAQIVSVSPEPGSESGLPATQLSFLGIDPADVGTITVTGSESGTDSGQFEDYSQGDGASWVPAAPFDAGETVTVATDLDIAGAPSGTYEFTIATQAPGAKTFVPTGPLESRGRGRIAPAHSPPGPYVSDPSLDPPQVTVDADAGGGVPGDIALTPFSLGPPKAQEGPMLVSQSGQPVWFDPISRYSVRDLKVQTYLGAPVLTWWQGHGAGVFGVGEDVVVNSSYKPVATVLAGNGLYADLHDFVLGDDDTAWVDAIDPIEWDLSSVGGPADGVVLDSVAQEIDVATGLVRFQWSSIDHIPLSDSDVPVSASDTTAAAGYNYFHINSIDPVSDDEVLISGRNVSQVDLVSISTGDVVWQLGGDESSFTMEPGASFAYQHDAEMLSSGQVSMFDDNSPSAPSEGLILELDLSTMTASPVVQLTHDPALYATKAGDLQELSGGGYFVDWGEQPYMSEFSPGDALVWDAYLPADCGTYRAYLLDWSGTPKTKPDVAVEPSSDGGSDTVYVSWNGATSVATWEILSGTSPSTLAEIATVAPSGFETSMAVAAGSCFEVRALNAKGQVMRSSHVVQPAPG